MVSVNTLKFIGAITLWNEDERLTREEKVRFQFKGPSIGAT